MESKTVKMVDDLVQDGFRMDEAIEVVKGEILVGAISRLESELSELNKNISALRSTIYDKG